jgi:hypothetical protein
MPPPSPGPTGPPDADRPPPLAAVVLRALMYALAVAILVVFTPGKEHVFIYQGF